MEWNKRMDFFNTLKQKLDLKFLYWHYLFLVLFFLALPFLAGILPIIRFTEEQIDIRVYPDYVLMQGIYVYQNPFPFPVVQGLSVPFPVDNDHPTPVQLTARQLAPKRKNLENRYILGRHRFNLFFNAYEQIQISVEYRQQAPKKNAKYILSTTRPWKHPLRKGRYRLFPQEVIITQSNYVLESGDHDNFIFQRKNFMPQDDWYFSWKVN
jgi:hypothetical protein